MSMYPEEYRYTKEHEWVKQEGGVGVVGITHHAQSELGDIVYVDLPKVGAKIDQGKSLGSVESVKAVSEIYSPVSGEVIEVNELLTAAGYKTNFTNTPSPGNPTIGTSTGTSSWMISFKECN